MSLGFPRQRSPAPLHPGQRSYILTQAAHADATAIRFHCAKISRKKHDANPKGSLANGRVHGRHSAPPFVVVLSNYFCPTVRSRIIAFQKWRPRIATLGLIAVQSYRAPVVIAEVNAWVILCKCKSCARRGTTRIPRWTPLRHLSGSAPPPSRLRSGSLA